MGPGVGGKVARRGVRGAERIRTCNLRGGRKAWGGRPYSAARRGSSRLRAPSTRYFQAAPALRTRHSRGAPLRVRGDRLGPSPRGSAGHTAPRLRARCALLGRPREQNRGGAFSGSPIPARRGPLTAGRRWDRPDSPFLPPHRRAPPELLPHRGGTLCPRAPQKERCVPATPLSPPGEPVSAARQAPWDCAAAGSADRGRGAPPRRLERAEPEGRERDRGRWSAG